MFDRIAHRYDVLNRTLSLGQDVVWRNRVTRHLPDFSGQHSLDLATGTGDQLISIFENSKRVKSGIGIDMAEKMLELGRPKLAKRNLDRAITLQTGNAAEIPFPEQAAAILVIRGDNLLAARGATRLSESDHVFVFCKREDRAFIELLFGCPAEDED